MRLDGLYGNDALKARLSAAFDSGRVAHSDLLCGPAGSGKPARSFPGSIPTSLPSTTRSIS